MRLRMSICKRQQYSLKILYNGIYIVCCPAGTFVGMDKAFGNPMRLYMPSRNSLFYLEWKEPQRLHLKNYRPEVLKYPALDFSFTL